MTNPLVIRYPLDPTGTNPNNLVIDETHTLVSRQVRAIAPIYGAFYAESLVVTDLNNQQQLFLGSQYYPAEMYQQATAQYGKEIDAMIIITDPNVSNNVSITYQAVGGEWSTSMQAIVQMIETLQIDNRPANWPDILNRPEGYPPVQHLHDIGDLYGFEYLVAALERIEQAILTGDDVQHDAIYQYIDRQSINLSPQVRAYIDQAVSDRINDTQFVYNGSSDVTYFMS